MGLLFNTFATDEKYPVLKKDNLTILIQMQLYHKQKKFFSTFLKSRLNFKHFDRKDDPHSFRISKITDLENVVR